MICQHYKYFKTLKTICNILYTRTFNVFDYDMYVPLYTFLISPRFSLKMAYVTRNT